MNYLRDDRKKHLQPLILALVALLSCSTSAFAGCLCNALASYVKCGGSVLFVAFAASAILLSRHGNGAAAKKILLAAVALLTISIAMGDALNSGLWYSEGVIANSQDWLEAGVPAHWISLLIIAIAYSILFIDCAMLPTIIAYRRHLENKRAFCNMNLMLLAIPGFFVIAPFAFFDLASCMVMMFWSALFTNPKALSEIPVEMLGSIGLWSVLLGLFAFFWSKLLFDVVQQKVYEVIDPSLS